jgi:hypothetical protein
VHGAGENVRERLQQGSGKQNGQEQNQSLQRLTSSPGHCVLS